MFQFEEIKNIFFEQKKSEIEARVYFFFFFRYFKGLLLDLKKIQNIFILKTKLKCSFIVFINTSN